MASKKRDQSNSKESGKLNRGLNRPPLVDIICNQNPSQEHESSSPRKEKDGFVQSHKKRLYPSLLPDTEVNGDQNQEYDEVPYYGKHQRGTTHPENEDITDDDVSEEEYIDAQLLRKSPIKPVIAKHKKRQPTSQIPNSSTSYKYVIQILCALVVILCAIAAAISGASYSPKLLEKFQLTNSRPQPVVANIIQNLKNDFGEQPPMTFKVISSALRRVLEPYPEAPAIILLLAEQGAEDIAGQFARKVADSVASSNNIVLVSGHTYKSEDHDVAKKNIDDLLTVNLKEDQLGAVLVDGLDDIPPQAAIIFHTYCDHEHAPFKRVVYLMTIASTKTQLKSLETKDWDTIVHDHLTKVWSSGGNDQISSLLSRLTVSIAAIVPIG